jgi:hypothetical protein
MSAAEVQHDQITAGSEVNGEPFDGSDLHVVGLDAENGSAGNRGFTATPRPPVTNEGLAKAVIRMARAARTRTQNPAAAVDSGAEPFDPETMATFWATVREGLDELEADMAWELHEQGFSWAELGTAHRFSKQAAIKRWNRDRCQVCDGALTDGAGKAISHNHEEA